MPRRDGTRPSGGNGRGRDAAGLVRPPKGWNPTPIDPSTTVACPGLFRSCDLAFRFKRSVR